MGTLDGSERVLCVPRCDLDSLLGPARPGSPGRFIPLDGPGNVRLDSALAGAVFLPRTEALEANPLWKQVIPYAIVTHSGRYLAYSRSTTSGDARLRSKRSLGLGGHVNPDDTRPDGMDFLSTPLDPRSTLCWCLARELGEEIGLGLREIGDLGLVGLIDDESNPVGEVHLGLVYVVNVTLNPDLRVSDEFKSLDGWHTPEELVALDPGPWESWSKLALGWLTAPR